MRESHIVDMPEPEATFHELTNRHLAEVLDRELSRLPDKYRIPIVLCELEGKTHREASEQLGWPIGTVSGRLSRAKSLLANRLTRRGVSVSAGSLSLLLAQDAASASLPPTLIGSTVQAASLMAAGRVVTAGIVSAKVANLTGRVLKMLLLAKIRTMMTILLFLGVIGLGLGLLLHPVQSLGIVQSRNRSVIGSPALAKSSEPARGGGLG